MKTVKVGNLVLGAGLPKVAVPITGKNEAEILTQAKEIVQTKSADLVEWRLDFVEQLAPDQSLSDLTEKLRQVLGTLPLLMTFRTKAEGGAKEYSEADYFKLNRYLLTEKLADLVDLELFRDSFELSELIELAHKQGVYIVMSNHDFDKTPELAEMKRRLTLMQNFGADILKIAVMPNSVNDVLKLLQATNESAASLTHPLITMAMGDLGKISRVSGQLFGSCLTFGSVGQASAPGQIESQMLRQILASLEIK